MQIHGTMLSRRRDWDHQEPVARVPSHRLLAMKRGEAEGLLRIGLTVDATLGMITLAQNQTVRIFSVVAVLFLLCCRPLVPELPSPLLPVLAVGLTQLIC